jgi:hypothetical protein
MSTFNSPEIMSYEKLTFYTVVSGLMTLARSEIKEKVREVLFRLLTTLRSCA